MLFADHRARARIAAHLKTLALAAAALAGALAYPLLVHASVQAGSAAPDFVLKATDGKNLRLSEYRGDVVVLAFWASWCGPCRAALTQLNELAPSAGAAAPVVLGVNLEGDAARASAVSKSLGLRYPTLVDSGQVVGRLYDVEHLPLTLVVDRDGVVRDAWSKAPPPREELSRRLQEIGP
jgi:peroxiredoxin